LYINISEKRREKMNINILFVSKEPMGKEKLENIKKIYGEEINIIHSLKTELNTNEIIEMAARFDCDFIEYEPEFNQQKNA
jgi:hypothetical protein